MNSLIVGLKLYTCTLFTYIPQDTVRIVPTKIYSFSQYICLYLTRHRFHSDSALAQGNHFIAIV